MTPPNPDDVALCAKFVGVKCSGSPTCLAHSPSPDLRVAIEDKLVSERFIVELLSESVVIYRCCRELPDGFPVYDEWDAPDIYAACADYLRRGK